MVATRWKAARVGRVRTAPTANMAGFPFDPKEAYYRVAPAAGVNASLHDMELWLIAQMGGRPDVLPQPLLDYLHTPGVPTPSEVHGAPWRRARLTSASYALGWRVFTYAGETMVFHAGEVEGYRTMIAFFPKYRIGIVSLWNSPGAIGTDLMPMVFDSMLGLPMWIGQASKAIRRPTRLQRKQPIASIARTTIDRCPAGIRRGVTYIQTKEAEPPWPRLFIL